MSAPPPPRLFVSYSWSTPKHEQWVLDLSTELVNSGVDVILDKWELREGHDSIAFMEKMVADPTISKVILVCDRVYADKANDRAGGVGTETQIISAEVYAKQAQDKFVAVIAEKDRTTDKPYLPIYYKSRIYVDLSESDRYAENFEKLLRWIFDKQLYIKPELGKQPSFITESNIPVLGTSVYAKRFIEGIKSDKAYARGAFDEYLTTLTENLEKFRINETNGEADDRIVDSIEAFTLSRNEFIQTIITLTQYADPDQYVLRLHRFFEAIYTYFFRPPHINSCREDDFDNFKFIVHELFLYAVALLLRGEHIESATYLLSQPYYVSAKNAGGSNKTKNYTVLREYLRSLETRKRRLGLERLSLRADLLEQRSKTSGIQFEHLMQADFVCFLRAELTSSDHYSEWWPETLVYVTHQHNAFELFARSASKAYLIRTLKLLGVTDISAISSKLSEYASNPQSIPRWDWDSINVSSLLGFEQLGTVA